jgi:transcription elongation factor Elf1
MVNHGELPQYYAENTHPAIISQEVFDKVQTEIKRRRELGARANKSIPTTVFTAMIECGQCGKNFRRSTKRQACNQRVYHVWTCQTKDQKGISACHAKDIPEKKLKEICSTLLPDNEFQDEVFLSRVERIIAVDRSLLKFCLKDGQEVTVSWESTAKKDWWTPERKKSWSEQNLSKATSVHRTRGYEFTGMLKCGHCGSNYRVQTTTLKNGEILRKWRCYKSAKECGREKVKSIRDDVLKQLVQEVLELSAFSEKSMDLKIENIVVLDDIVTFYFKDGDSKTLTYKSPRACAPWSEIRKQHPSKAMKAKWREKRDQENNDESSNN